jgi:hypothetical protein
MTNKQLSIKMIQMDERLMRVEENMATKSDIHNIMNFVDGIAKTITKISTEVSIINSRTKSIEDWIIEASPKIRISYNT